jgi:diguanylate cyclase (GGDEF)-like protein
MREILELCIELDRMACEAYGDLARTCHDPELSSAFESMSCEERGSIDWWGDLLIAWDAGLVPDIADEHHLLKRLRQIHDELAAALPADCSGCSNDDALDLAARFEFYMLDPLFGELIELTQPGSKDEALETYSGHVMRLIELIETRYTRPGSARFLAGVLKTAYRDQQRLAALAVRDQLTGLYNRRGLFGHLKQWLAWSWRYGRPVGIILIDVDHFKRVNEAYGHPAGDEALRHIASILESSLRASDMVGRFGGDEFLILAPETDGAELESLMARAISSVQSTPLELGDALVSLSVSAGGAWAPGGVDVGPDTLVAQADRSLHDAKESGRNRAGSAVSAGRS